MKKLIVSVVFSTLCFASWNASAADKPIDSVAGETLYNTYCFMCHDRGLGHAPRPGDKGDWAKLLPLGENTLYNAVIDGPSHMYSKGISPIWSEWQLKSMIHYLTSTVTDAETQQQIGSASEADKAHHLRLMHGRKLYEQACFKCHNYGDLAAPKLGNAEAWAARKDKGIDALVKTVIDGKNHMYTHGGSNSLSTEEFKMMTEYMLSTLEQGWVAPQQDCK